MKEFRVCVSYSGWDWVKVKAKDEDDAKEKVMNGWGEIESQDGADYCVEEVEED